MMYKQIATSELILLSHPKNSRLGPYFSSRETLRIEPWLFAQCYRHLLKALIMDHLGIPVADRPLFSSLAIYNKGAQTFAQIGSLQIK